MAMTQRAARIRLTAFAVALLGCVAAGGAVAEARSPQPEASLRETMERASALPRLLGFAVSIEGEVVVERYFRGARPSQWANVKSVSKSVMSALVGIAVDRGYIESVRTPIAEFFPERLSAAEDAAKKTITIEDLLTMRSGLETTSNRNYGRWVTSGNWVTHVLDRPLTGAPGGRMIYSTGNFHLLSAILTRATGMNTLDFARRYLAGPLDISIGSWPCDPQGIYFGGNEMHLTLRGMIKIGELYLNRGRAGDRQVVSSEWIAASVEPRTRSSWSGREYGYGWWIATFAGHPTFYAWGHGGQFIFVAPDLELVAAVTSSSSSGPERRGHRQAIYNLIEEILLSVAKNGSTAVLFRFLDKRRDFLSPSAATG